MSLFCEKADLLNESDVEQKFLYNFLSSDYPMGCGYSPSDILTKHRIIPYTIGKTAKKVYIPDYIISLYGIPLIVLEAKHPNISLEQAYNEARLYAHEINSQWQHGENPCKRIIVSNGLNTLAGFYDESTPQIEISFDEYVVGNINFNKLCEFASKTQIVKFHQELIKKKRKNSRFERPVGRIGLKRAVDAEIKSNTFGQALSIEYRSILSPDSESEYKNIVQNAFVHSKRKDTHVEPILKVIKRVRLPSIDESKPISSNDNDILNLFDSISEQLNTIKSENSLLLLIGNVGSGKSTFIRYIQNVAIPQKTDLVDNLYWNIINMNYAPMSKDKIYGWTVECCIENIINNFGGCNFSNVDFLNTLYKEEIKEFEQGVGSYLIGTTEYKIQLFNLIKQSKDDKELTLKRLIDYVKIKYSKSIIFVYDNVDQGAADRQLLIFQVAEWFRNKYNSLVMMSLRDSTYNEYRAVPPLDTIIKNHVFRIDPPDLLAVLQERLKYICRIEQHDIQTDRDYVIENGMKVILKENEYLEYFKYILHSIRQDGLIRSVFYSIAGRDVRSGIELFIEFCKSGHLLASDIFAVKASGGTYTVPHYRMMEAVLRGTRLYYSSQNSKIKNVFSSDFSDEWVDPFVRVDVLIWLNDRRDIKGDSGTKGFFTVKTIFQDMELIGHERFRLMQELETMIQDRLILSGNLENVTSCENLIRISPYGSLHLQLLGNINYLSACSEDVLYRNLEIAQNISDRITGKTGDGYLSKTTMLSNVEDMINYLQQYRKDYISQPQNIIRDINIKIFDLAPCVEAISSMKIKWDNEVSIAEKKEKFPPNTIVDCLVTSIQSYGLFVTMECIEDGFISMRSLGTNNPYDFNIADIITAKVIQFRKDHGRFELLYISRVINQ